MWLRAEEDVEEEEMRERGRPEAELKKREVEARPDRVLRRYKVVRVGF